MKIESAESGGEEVPGGLPDTNIEVAVKGLLVLVALAVILPLLIPLVGLIGGLTLGFLGLVLGLTLGALGLVLNFVILGLKLVLGLVGLALGLAPVVAVVLLVLVVIDRGREQA